MMSKILAILTVLLATGTAIAQFESGEPFGFSASVARSNAGEPVVAVDLAPASNHYVYAESLTAALPEGDDLSLLRTDPPPVRKFDPFLEKEAVIHEQAVTLFFSLPAGIDPGNVPGVDISYQGCNQNICFLPKTVRLTLDEQDRHPPEKEVAPVPPEGASRPSGSPEPLDWRILASESGYHEVDSFLEFLDNADGAAQSEAKPDRLRSLFDRGAYWLMILLVLAGGLALNLTPCVLPMIPVNLAIIGAGARQGSSRRGFALGSVYGLGMAVAYGLLGILVVVAGAQFGAINASWGFNLAIAGIFFVLALAMFDIITIDLSRWQFSGAGHAGGSVLLAFGFGALSALLAGACVAPVVISVLLLSANLYAGGDFIGLLLPFLLGAGMALPWPFAGAGMSVLPKPGRWMNRVKIFFGILILLLALYYGAQAVRLGSQAWQSRKAQSTDITREMQKLSEAASRARKENKPILVDFWATWCKNCLAMEKTTFKDPAVRQRLEDDFVFIKVQAERPSDPETREILNAFGVIGLPTYVALAPPDVESAPE